jgi:hypothetical protein
LSIVEVNKNTDYFTSDADKKLSEEEQAAEVIANLQVKMFLQINSTTSGVVT